MKKERGLALAACAALAALMLLFASQCSPLYPINLWDDANCLLTVGRVMRRGGVLYRDIYEQKGPLLYLIHALAACISDTSFWGVYALEIPALTAALYAAYRLLRLRTGAGFALGAAAVWGALTVTGGSFMRGDSAEEFCLPLLTAALALAYAEYGRRARPMRAKRLLLCGVLAGGIATIKYTLLGAMVGLCAVEGALALKEGGVPRALKSAGVFLAGMAIPILPWVIYFAANGALRDAYTAYIYNNVFLYGGEAASWGQRLGELARCVQKNALWAVPAALGLAAQSMNDRCAENFAHFTALRQRMSTNLSQSPAVCINSPADAAPYIVNCSVQGIRSEVMIHYLEQFGIYVSSGSACAKGERSHVLTAMGLSRDRIDSAVRVSMTDTTTAGEIDEFCRRLLEGEATLTKRR